MRLESLSPVAFAIGLGLLASATYFLQRLRVRHREQLVVTTLFWREAVEDTRARVLMHRFRHPLAYLLAFAIAGLLLFALATPRADTRGTRDYVVLLDTSATAAPGARFDELCAALPALVAQLPRDARRVIACGGESRTLLAPGEEEIALRARLAGLSPEAAAPAFERELEGLVHGAARGRPLTAILLGDAPVSTQLESALPEGWRLHRVSIAGALATNHGIRALGSSPAASGRWDEVDVLIELSDPSADMQLELEGVALAVTPERDGKTAIYRGLPARGGLLRVRLPSKDSIPLDDQACIVLPDRPTISVACAPRVDESLRAIVAADPGLFLTAVEDAQVALRRAGDEFGMNLPALELVAESAQEEAILLLHARGDDSARVLVESLGELGIEPEVAARVASRTGRAIAVGAAPAEVRGAGIWSSLLEPRAGFVGTRAFPVCIAGLLRYVAGVEPCVQYAAAGEALVGSTSMPWRDAAGRVHDPLDAAFTPTRAGLYTAEDGRRLSVSLAAVALDARPLDFQQDALLSASSGPDLVIWIGILVLALASLEWVLYQRGRMP